MYKPKRPFFQKPKGPFFQKPKGPFFQKPKGPFFQKPKRHFFQKSKGPFFQKPKRHFFQKSKRPFRRPSPLPPIQSGDRIDYKNTSLLSRFISEQGKILSRRVTRVTLKQQRLITIAIKQARILSLLPFIYNYKIFERIKSTIIRTAKFRNKKKKFEPKRKNRSFFRKK